MRYPHIRQLPPHRTLSPSERWFDGALKLYIVYAVAFILGTALSLSIRPSILNTPRKEAHGQEER